MSTRVEFVNRDEVAAAKPRPIPPQNIREDEIANEKGIAELLLQITQARRELRLTEQSLAEVELSLAGTKSNT